MSRFMLLPAVVLGLAFAVIAAPKLALAQTSPLPPQSPRFGTNPTLTAGTESLTVAWRPPASGTTPTGYEICVGPAETNAARTRTRCDNDHSTISKVTAGAAETSLVLTSTNVDIGINVGTEYRVVVSSTHANGDSTRRATNPATEAPEAAPVTPGVPPAVTATAGDDAITVSWTEPTDALTTTRYDICVVLDSETESFADACNLTDGTESLKAFRASASPVTVTSGSFDSEVGVRITNGTAYRVAVRARASGGDNHSDWTGATGPVTPVAVPVAAPTAVTATAGDDAIVVSWTPATDSVATTGYNICVVLASETESSADACNLTDGTESKSTYRASRIPVTVTTSHFDGVEITNDTAYRVAVRTLGSSEDHHSAWADATGPVTPMAVPVDAPTAVTATAGDDAIAVSWTPPTDAVATTRYNICVVLASETEPFADACNLTDGTESKSTYRASRIPVTVTTSHFEGAEIANDTAYRVAVRTLGSSEDRHSAWAGTTGTVTPSATPHPPTGVSASPGDRRFTVSWLPSTSTLAATGYEVCVATTLPGNLGGVNPFNPADGLTLTELYDIACNPALNIAGVSNSPATLRGINFGEVGVVLHNEGDLVSTTVDGLQVSIAVGAYRVAMRAVTDDAASAWVDAGEITLNGPNDLLQPREVIAVGASSGSQAQIAVSWLPTLALFGDRPVSNSAAVNSICVLGPAVTGSFETECSDAAGTVTANNFTNAQSPASVATSSFNTGTGSTTITDGNDYRVAVRYDFGGRTSAWVAAADTATPGTTPPNQPTDVTATRDTTNPFDIDLAWDLVTATFDTEATEFQIEVSRHELGFDVTDRMVLTLSARGDGITQTKTNYTFTMPRTIGRDGDRLEVTQGELFTFAANGDSYSFKVRAVSSTGGIGAYSDASTALFLPLTISDMTVSSNSVFFGDEVTVTVTLPAAPVIDPGQTVYIPVTVDPVEALEPLEAPETTSLDTIDKDGTEEENVQIPLRTGIAGFATFNAGDTTASVTLRAARWGDATVTLGTETTICNAVLYSTPSSPRNRNTACAGTQDDPTTTPRGLPPGIVGADTPFSETVAVNAAPVTDVTATPLDGGAYVRWTPATLPSGKFIEAIYYVCFAPATVTTFSDSCNVAGEQRARVTQLIQVPIEAPINFRYLDTTALPASASGTITLANGTEYRVAVRTVQPGSAPPTNAWVEAATTVTPNMPPNSLTATQVTDTLSVDLGWSDGACAAGGNWDVLIHDLYAPASVTVAGVTTTGAAQCSANITAAMVAAADADFDWILGGTYTFRVAAAGSGLYSDSAVVVNEDGQLDLDEFRSPVLPTVTLEVAPASISVANSDAIAKGGPVEITMTLPVAPGQRIFVPIAVDAVYGILEQTRTTTTKAMTRPGEFINGRFIPSEFFASETVTSTLGLYFDADSTTSTATFTADGLHTHTVSLAPDDQLTVGIAPAPAVTANFTVVAQPRLLTSLAATAGDNAITVTWDLDGGGTQPTGFQFCILREDTNKDILNVLVTQCGSSPDFDGWLATTDDATARTITLDSDNIANGVHGGIEYRVVGRGTHSGVGRWTELVTPTSKTVTPTGTPPPLSVMAGPAASSIVASWEAVPDATVTGYQVCATTAAAFDDTNCAGASVVTAGATDTTATVTGLANGTAYQVAVRATGSGGGNSDWVAAPNNPITPQALTPTITANRDSITVGQPITITVHLPTAPGRNLVMPVTLASALVDPLNPTKESRFPDKTQAELDAITPAKAEPSALLTQQLPPHRQPGQPDPFDLDVGDALGPRNTQFVYFTADSTTAEISFNAAAIPDWDTEITAGLGELPAGIDNSAATTADFTVAYSGRRFAAPSGVLGFADDGNIIVLWEPASASETPNGYEVCVLPDSGFGGFPDTCLTASQTLVDSSTTLVTITEGITNGTTYRVAVRAIGDSATANSAWIASTPETHTPMGTAVVVGSAANDPAVGSVTLTWSMNNACPASTAVSHWWVAVLDDGDLAEQSQQRLSFPNTGCTAQIPANIGGTVTEGSDFDLEFGRSYAFLVAPGDATAPTASFSEAMAVTIQYAAAITLSENTIAEEATVDVTLTLPGALGVETIVPLAPSALFTPANPMVTFGATETTATTTLTAVDTPDSLVDATVTITLGDTLPDGIVAGQTATLTITNDDLPPGLILSKMMLTVDEDGGTDTYTVALASRPTGDVMVFPDASSSTDVTISPSNLTFTTGNWSEPQTVTITGVNDDGTEPRTAIITHTASGDGYDGVAAVTVTVTLTDDDSTLTPLAMPAFTATAGDASIVVTISAAVTNAEGYDVCAAIGTAADAFNACDGGGTFASTTGGGLTATITLDAAGNALVNDTAYFVYARSTSTNVAFSNSGWSAGGSAAVTPMATPDTPDVPGLPTAVSATGGDNAITVTWTAAGAPADQSYDVCVLAGDSTATFAVGCNSADDTIANRFFFNSPGTLVSGDFGGVTTIVNGNTYRVAVRSDLNDVKSAWADGGTVTPTATAANTPAPPTNVSATGGDNAITVTWTDSVGEPQPDGYDVCVVPSSNAGAFADVCTPEIGRSNTLFFGSPATVTSADFEAGTTTITNGVEYRVAVRSYTLSESVWVGITGTVTPATPPADLPTLSIAAVAASVTEAAGAMLAFTITSDINAPSGGISVTVTLTGADDFVENVADRTQTAVIAAGTTTATVNFPITDDATDEPEATATATLGDSAAYEGDGATATAMILDDDAPAATPTLSIATVAASVTEAAGAMLAFTITSDINAPSGGISVTVTLTGADDFVENVADRTQTAVIAAGTTTATVNFPITDDATDEPEATATATINTGADYTVGDPGIATVTVTDVDPEMVRVASVTSVAALDKSTAQLATGLIVQRFVGGRAGAGQQSAPLSSLVSSVTARGERNGFASGAFEADVDGRLSFGGEVATDAERGVGSIADVTTASGADWGVENLSHTAPAPGSLASRYGSDGNWRRFRSDEFSPLRLLARNPLSFSLAGVNDALAGANVWASAAYADLSGTPDGDSGTRYDGSVTSLQTGVDTQLGRALIGLSVGWNTGEVDFTQQGDGNPLRGEIERESVSVHPYFSWRSGENHSLWLLAGYGSGDYTLTLAADGDTVESDATQWTAAGGVESLFKTSSAFEITGRASALWSESEVDGGALLAFDSSSWQVQTELEIARAGECTWRPYALGALRLNGGDGSDGLALDFGGGVKGEFADIGLSFDLGARGQLNKTDSNDRVHVFYGTLRYDAGNDARGFTAALTQGLSQALQSRWRTGDFSATSESLNPNPGFKARFGYGWGASLAGHAGTLTLFSELRNDAGGAASSLGLDFQNAALELRLEAQSRPDEQRTQLRLQTRF